MLMREAERLSREEFRDRQWAKFRLRLEEWYASNPFYRRLLDEARVTPDDVLTFDDLRRLPMVTATKDYRFEGRDGPVSLLDLFEGRRQLAVYHFMFGPEWEAGCPGCTAVIDEVAPGRLAHLHARDTSFAVVSRAPFAKLESYKAARGWTIDCWYSSHGSDFNYDFHVTFDASVSPVLFNYRDANELATTKHAWAAQTENQPVEVSGLSFFLREGDEVFHTYSAYQRGTEPLIGAYERYLKVKEQIHDDKEALKDPELRDMVLEELPALEADVVRLEFEWGQPVDPDDLAKVVEGHPKAKVVLLTHNETSTGLTNPLRELARVAHDASRLVVVDGVSSISSIARRSACPKRSCGRRR